MRRESVILTATDEKALAGHLEYLRLAGHADTSRYARQRAVVRMAAVLGGVVTAPPADVAAWRAALTVEPDTAAHYIAHAREFYAWCVAAGYRGDNPAGALPSPPTRRRLPRPIDEEGLALAVETATERIRPWLVLAAWAGLRAKEIAYLRRENVLDTADPPALLIVDTATKGHQERVVPLCRFAAAELAPHLPRSGYVFRRRDGKAGPNQPWLVSQLSSAHLHDCGLGETLHQLRHRFGTATYRASHDLRLVQELLGHASPTTTAGYAAYDRAAAATTVNELPAPKLRRIV